MKCIVLMVEKTYFDSIINSEIERKWLAVLNIDELPKRISRQVEEGTLTTMYMKEQDFIDLEGKVTEIVKQKKGFYIKSHSDLISNVTMNTMRRIYLPKIVGVLQICVV